MEYRLISAIEKIGCVDGHGHHLYGTAALLHMLHRPVSSFSESEMNAGRAYLHKHYGVYPTRKEETGCDCSPPFPLHYDFFLVKKRKSRCLKRPFPNS